ncbi:hypothetical protein VKT23_010624 [Stygiomarasmius scandens]|uniref:Uncharacterized protein n=1 Tax=Marasmiellus scandens TaxID=2682957 RepID=A0ABR1JBQ3_9AGAR
MPTSRQSTTFDDEEYTTSRSSSPSSSSSSSFRSRRSCRKLPAGTFEAYDIDNSPPVSRISHSHSRPRKRKGRCKTEAERRATLENDPWSDATRLTSKSVFCMGCKKDIKLDKRNEYYPGLWLKHRKLCPGIRSAKAIPIDQKPNVPSIPQINDVQAAWILESMSIKNSRSFERQEDSEMVDVAVDLLWTFCA